MRRLLFALLASIIIAAPSAAQQVNLVTEFTEVAQSPPYLNCNARLTTEYQGSVLMRGRITIRDASAALKADVGSDDWSVPPINFEAAYGTVDTDPAGIWNCYFDGEVIFDYSERVSVTGSQQAVICPGERGAIRAEYIAKPELGWVPTCDQIQQYPE